jgi:tripartite-type tricarboxylate transporter receptor subunit TctC
VRFCIHYEGSSGVHVDKALDDPNTRKRLLELGAVIPDKPQRGQQALAALVKSDIARWAPIMKAANVRVD